MSRHVVVLARGATPRVATPDCVLVDWDGVCEGAYGVLSVRDLVEAFGGRLRARFAAWVHDLGLATRNCRAWRGRRDRLNPWWLTTLAEKCNWDRSPWIHDALRLMAFEEWASTAAVGRVELVGGGPALAECFRRWGRASGVSVTYAPAPSGDTMAWWRRRAFGPVVALMWLGRHVVSRWTLRQLADARWTTADGTHMFFSFLLGLPVPLPWGSQQASRYWTSLPDSLTDAGTTRWVHLFEPDPNLPDAAAAAKALSTLSSSSAHRHLHVALDSFLSVPLIVRTVGEWVGNSIRWTLTAPTLRSVRSEGLDLWPLCESEWVRTTRGPEAMSAILNCCLFTEALSGVPRQAVGLLPYENQAWEAAMSAAWRAAGHDTLIGYCHSTVRYWDVRYVHDVRTYLDTPGQRPLPDIIATHSLHERAILEDAGYPPDRVVEVEALRYLYLNSLEIPTSGPVSGPAVPNERLVVLGDYAASTTASQLALLEQAMSHVTTPVQITVKPHPATPVRSDDYPGLRMSSTTVPLHQLLREFSVAYVGPMTTAAVEAWCAGLRVITMVPAGQLNLSPLRGLPDVVSVSTAAELAAAICAPIGRRKERQYFNLDPDLRRWRSLLHSIRRRQSGQEG